MRSTEQILSEMDSVQATIPEAAVLTSKSKTAVFGTLRAIWALFVQTLERNMDALKAELTSYVATIQVGSLAWYASQVRAFQFGDSLTLIAGRPGYAVIDPAKQIVTQAAVIETEGRLLIKTAKKNDGVAAYRALAAGELGALQEYVRQVKYAGVAVDVVSLEPDELRILATVKYDRQIMNVQGQLLTNTVDLPVWNAIINYIRALPFNSVLNWTQLTDYCQAQPGILDFVITNTYIRPAGSTQWVEFRRETVSNAGHMKLIDAGIIYV